MKSITPPNSVEPTLGEPTLGEPTSGPSTPIVHLRSEDVIVQAPFSFVGSTKRTIRAMGPWAHGSVERFQQANGTGAKSLWGLATVAAYSLIVTVLLMAWLGVATWYVLFGLLLVPYRLIRRSDRNRKRQELQHRELMASTIAAARKD